MTINQSDNDEVREIQAGTAPTRFARGWHCLGLTESFTDGKPHPIEAFGTKLVVFADSDGNVNVLDAYCRHMGGDLTQGTVKGDEIACPFHDWRWGGDGKCQKIPYARRVPAARPHPRRGTTLVQDGMLFVWNDPEGNPPPDGRDDPPHRRRLERRVDRLGLVHHHHRGLQLPRDRRQRRRHGALLLRALLVPDVLQERLRGPRRHAVHAAASAARTCARTQQAPRSCVGNTSVATYHGPSFMIDDLTYHYEDGDVDSRPHQLPLPDRRRTRSCCSTASSSRSAEHLDGEAADAMARRSARSSRIGFEQDVEIWKNKTRIDNPLLCEEDGPVYQLRRWYEQFYVDVADVTPEMTERFEFEIDTTRPVDAWQREVEDNLAAKKADEDAASSVR